MNIIIAKNDSFLNNDEKNYVIDNIVQCDDFPVYLNTASTFDKDDVPWASHILIARYNIKTETPKFNSPHTQFFINVLHRFADENNIKVNQIYRACINVMFGNCTKQFVAQPHIDHPEEHKNFILYLNDVHGDTVFFNTKKIKPKDKRLKKPIHRESPKFGKAIIFHGHTYHTAEPPLANEKRLICVMTFN